MTDTTVSPTKNKSGERVQDEPLTIREHLDPDKHWIGEALAPPTQSEIAATVGTVSGPGDSPFVARADHLHKLDTGLFMVSFSATPGAADDATGTTTMTHWLTSNSTFTVPTWATSAVIHVDLANIYLITSTAAYYLSAIITGASFSANDVGAFSPATISERESTSFTYTTTGFSTGPGQSVLIGARRTVGTGLLRADPSSRITGFISFRTA